MTAQRKTLLREVVERKIDKETGEVTEQKHIKETKVDQEPDYVKLYLADVAYLCNVKGTDPLIHELLKRVSYDGLLYINSSMKKSIAFSINQTLGHVNNQISMLSKKMVFIRRDRGVYEANPYIFGKGKWKDVKSRRDDIGYMVYYDEKGNRVVKFSVGEKWKSQEGTSEPEAYTSKDDMDEHFAAALYELEQEQDGE